MPRRTPAPGTPGARLRRLIEAIPAETRPSEREIARRASLPRSTVHFVLSGRVPNPGIETVQGILGAVGLTLADYHAVAAKPAKEPAIPG